MRAWAVFLGLFGIALLSASSVAHACQTTKQLPEGEEVTGIACAIDGVVAPIVARLLLESKETLDTRLVSADLEAQDGHPVVRQVFEHWLYSDQVEELLRLGLGGGVAVIAQRASIESRLPVVICATFDSEALMYFRAGGGLRVVVLLRAVDKARNVDAMAVLADVTLDGCGES